MQARVASNDSLYNRQVTETADPIPIVLCESVQIRITRSNATTRIQTALHSGQQEKKTCERTRHTRWLSTCFKV